MVIFKISFKLASAAVIIHIASVRSKANELTGIHMASKTVDIETVLNLSELQIRILLWLYDTTAMIEEELGFMFIWGARWTFSQDENLEEYSDQAISRSLQRLESRGFLLRSNYISEELRYSPSDAPPSRTTAVKFTAIGREVAELITRCHEPDPNHSG